MRLTIVIALLLLLGIFTIMGGGGGEEESDTLRFIVYEASVRPLNTVDPRLVELFEEAPETTVVHFNDLEVEVSVSGPYRVLEGLLGKKAIAEAGIYDPEVEGKFRKTSDAEFLIVELKVREREGGMEPPVVKVGSPLLSLLMLGARVSKDVELNTLAPVLVLEGHYTARKEVAEGTCIVEGASPEKHVCVFIFPSDRRPQYVLISAFPPRSEGIARAVFEGFGYPVAKLRLQ